MDRSFFLFQAFFPYFSFGNNTCIHQLSSQKYESKNKTTSLPDIGDSIKENEANGRIRETRSEITSSGRHHYLDRRPDHHPDLHRCRYRLPHHRRRRSPVFEVD